TWAALAKDPSERYASVGDLARDLRALLAGTPVAARDQERGYRLRQSLRALVLPLAILAATVLVLSGVIVFLLDVSRRETQLRETADRHFEQARESAQRETQLREAADRHFAQAREFAGSFIHDIAPSLRYLPGSAPARERIVERGRGYLDTLSRQGGEDPTLLLELAHAWVALGEVQWDREGVALGKPEGALASFDRALQTLERIDLDSLELARLRLRAKLRKAGTLGTLQRQAEAATTLGEAYAEAELLAAEHPTNRDVQRELAYSLESMSAFDRAGDPNQALVRLERAAEITARLLDDDPSDAHLRRDRAVSLTKIAQHLLAHADPEAALARYREYREEALLLLEVSDLRWVARRDVAVGHEWVGRLLADLGKPGEALPYLEQARQSYQALFDDDPSQFTHAMSASSAVTRIGEALISIGDLAGAEARFAEATGTILALRDEHPTLPRLHRMAGVLQYKAHELQLARAAREGLTEEERRAFRERGLTDLEACLASFESMAAQGLLSPGDAGVPDELRAEIEALRVLLRD
ncbi:MAG: hypothetical protein O2816_13700, partial [Planctomycetota bacterium]|nr:hypothetical protein [Planctomycetota bacterium]